MSNSLSTENRLLPFDRWLYELNCAGVVEAVVVGVPDGCAHNRDGVAGRCSALEGVCGLIAADVECRLRVCSCIWQASHKAKLSATTQSSAFSSFATRQIDRDASKI